MPPLFRSLFAKFSLALFGLLLLLAAVQLAIYVRFTWEFLHENFQLLQWEIAPELAERLEPLLEQTIDYTAVRRELDSVTLLYSQTAVYILDQDGAVLLSVDRTSRERKLDSVPLEPVRRFIAAQHGKAPVIYGSDPQNPDAQVVFSAAPLTVLGKPGYLYVTLSSGRARQTIEILGNSYIGASTLIVGLISFTIIGFVGVLIFFLLSRRLKRLARGVERFSEGELATRIDDAGKDEVGMLAHSFNAMADSLAELIGRLKKTDILRRELVLSVAHDLRNPITAIYGFSATLIDKDLQLNEEQRERAFHTIHHSSEVLNQLASDLFELAKVDAQDITPDPVPFDLQPLVESVLDRMRFESERAGISLCSEVHSNTPYVFADRDLIERVFSNLVSNGIKYNRPGGQLEIDVRRGGGGVQVTVSDTGIGIPEPELDRIFDQFARVSQEAETEVAGEGVGLYIVKKILGAHGCRIGVQSSPGEGTEFRFVLPPSRE